MGKKLPSIRVENTERSFVCQGEFHRKNEISI
jgi:hypothetical protein